MTGSKTPVLSKSRARSRVTNGRALLPKGADGRSLWYRRFRDLNALHLSDLGGVDDASEGEKAIVRRCATLIVALEQMEFQFATKGDATPNQLDQYQRLANSLRRLLESVGLKRRPREVTPDLQSYLASKSNERTRHTRGRVLIEHED